MYDFDLEKTSMTAKILANEDLSVRRRQAEYPSFDLQHRILNIPPWNNLDLEIDDMIVCHEVGHALFTPADGWELGLTQVPKSYLNIVEDARIERLFKKKYPGSKKVFSAAICTTFFKTKLFPYDKKTVNENFNLIDRINIYYKNGFIFSGVVFTKEEKVFVERIDKAESFDEVIEIAKDIYNFTNVKIEERKEAAENAEQKMNDDSGKTGGQQEPEQETQDRRDTDGTGEGYGSSENDDREESESEEPINGGSGDESEENGDPTGAEDESEENGDPTGAEDESEENGDPTGSAGGNDDKAGDETAKSSATAEDESENEEETTGADSAESVTNGIVEENLLKEIKHSGYNENQVLNDDYSAYEMVIPFKEILKNITPYLEEQNNPLHRNRRYGDLVEGYKKEVNYLSQQFEMRKAAKVYARRRVAKTGVIDGKKLACYRVKDDIFKKNMISADGKKHGMVMLLDWSGSMYDVINNVVKQLYMLTAFCRRSNIPFVVYAFRSEHNVSSKSGVETNHDASQVKLLELFSSDMNSRQFGDMFAGLLTGLVERFYSMSQTPLAASIAYMRVVIPRFQAKYKVEKTSFITFTDGQDNRSNWYARGMVDPVTRKVYEIDTYNGSTYQLSAVHQSINHINNLYQLLKDRFNTTNVTFFITKRFHIREFTKAFLYTGLLKEYRSLWNNNVSKIRKDRYFEVKNAASRDLIVVFDKTLINRGATEELIFAEKATARQIASELRKKSVDMKKSRVLLENFIKTIS